MHHLAFMDLVEAAFHKILIYIYIYISKDVNKLSINSSRSVFSRGSAISEGPF